MALPENSASQNRLDGLLFDGISAGDSLLQNTGLDPDANFFQNCCNLQSKYYDIEDFVSQFKDANASQAPFSSTHFNSRSIHKNLGTVRGARWGMHVYM